MSGILADGILQIGKGSRAMRRRPGSGVEREGAQLTRERREDKADPVFPVIQPVLPPTKERAERA